MNFDLPACHGCGAEVPSDAIDTGTCPACGVALYSNPEEARRYIHKARNSGNAAEAYECCRLAINEDLGNVVAWAERFRISFWLNSELKGNTSKTIPPETQLAFLEQALKATDEELQKEVAKVIIRFVISECILDQHIHQAPLEMPVYLVRFQQFLQILPSSARTRLKEELIYLTGESLNKSLSATCRINNRRQNFLNLCACLTVPVKQHASPLYIRIYETLEALAGNEEEIKRTGFLCLVSSNQPDEKQENTQQAGQRSGPNYEIGDWPLGVQIVSGRIPDTLLSAWLTQWVFAYQNFLGMDTHNITIKTYECLGNPTELATQLQPFSHSIQ